MLTDLATERFVDCLLSIYIEKHPSFTKCVAIKICLALLDALTSHVTVPQQVIYLTLLKSQFCV